ncbi:MAG: fluoride efflux transporter CrcB [Candidatus Omnitrophota bacterium]|jgi:CrcB protein
MLRFLLVAAGGAIGTVFRYSLSGLDYKFSNGVFPFSTLLVNLTGSFFIGFLWGLFEGLAVSPHVRMFIFIGILGGFTTFSTFSLENFNLLRAGEIKIAVSNIFIANIGGIALVFIGFILSRCLISLFK